ncbi:DUF1003 domain-containing protein [Actinomadura harenae]|uniref:DUF1003 domain-containing protein n=1 Tax=Actinomadura harenae TaxID=2483351 RepID=UPI0013152C04|nr:DUF1003 domain-containing protein [Actinomadura harenae]
MSATATAAELPQAAELPEAPATIADERVGLNGAIAAALTRGVGSMGALYVVLVIITVWMALAAWGPLRSIDPYPFGFLLFLNNVVQLVLCSVILVGQRVLGQAADRRAVQTYENTGAIFARISDLQANLDRHDRALSRGVSLLESRPHPWIERHRVQSPPQALDHAVGVNGRIAAWLTERLGSMWAFYISAGTQVLWIGAAELGIQRFDPYPFAFMSFLSTFAQLLFMIVIMVGQDVLGRAADRRSEQTFLDAEAILHECRRMKTRLAAQGRVIDSLADYTSSHLTEHLARNFHERRPDTVRPGWDELPEHHREAQRRRARRLGEHLAVIGYLMVPATGAVTAVVLDEQQAQTLARLEHGQSLDERDAALGEAVPWDHLPDDVRDQAVGDVLRIPALLAEIGFQVLPSGDHLADGPGELDFTPEDWDTLHRALMAAGVLVALAEGVADAEEIFALVTLLRETGVTHPRRFVRELAATTPFETGLQPDSRYAQYAGPALETIRQATAIVARTAPSELAAFRALVSEIADTVADANDEGGFFGLGARPRVPAEAAAMEAIRKATHHPEDH